MKIGVVTWFQSSNYGTCLQAIALQQYLRNLGYHVEIINFRVIAGKPKKKSLWERICYQPEKYLSKYYCKKYQSDIMEKEVSMEETVNAKCVLTDKVHNREDYMRICKEFDLLVFGSDQIWNPNWYHEYYYADFPEITTRKISYAPSLGVSHISQDALNKIKKSLSRFEAVSIRETRGARLLETISPVKPQVVVDPTLLLNRQEWNSVILTGNNKKNTERYVLSMFLTDNFRHWHAAKKFAQKKKLKHFVVPYCGISYMQGDQVFVKAGLEDLLTLIRDADYILTDSFHITVFSLIYNRQFVVFERFKENNDTSQNSRVQNLMKMIDEDNRLLSHGTALVPKIVDVDYRKVNKLLQKEINQSKEFLDKAIKGFD